MLSPKHFVISINTQNYFLLSETEPYRPQRSFKHFTSSLLEIFMISFISSVPQPSQVTPGVFVVLWFLLSLTCCCYCCYYRYPFCSVQITFACSCPLLEIGGAVEISLLLLFLLWLLCSLLLSCFVHVFVAEMSVVFLAFVAVAAAVEVAAVAGSLVLFRAFSVVRVTCMLSWKLTVH